MKLRLSIECWLISDDNPADPRALLLRTPPDPSGLQFWQAITGEINLGESDPAACQREVREETGIQLPLPGIQPVGLDLEIPVLQHNWIIKKHTYWARTTIQPIKLSHEHVESRWVPFNQVEATLHWPTCRQIYREVHQLTKIPQTKLTP